MNGTLNWKRYAGVYILSMIGLMIVGLLLERLLGFSLPSGLSVVLPPMMAALIEGQKRADAGLEPYGKAEAWSAASLATMVVGVITRRRVGGTADPDALDARDVLVNLDDNLGVGFRRNHGADPTGQSVFPDHGIQKPAQSLGQEGR